MLAATGDQGADVVYDLTGGDVAERSWRCTARGGRYLAVGFADDDQNGMTGRPLRMACLGNIDIVCVMLGWAESVDPGMRRFGFNPFGRDVADEVHGDLLHNGVQGAIRPFIGRRVTMEEAGRALDEHEARRSVGSHRRGDRSLTDRGYTWRDSELQSKPLRALNKVGAQLSRMGVTRPSLTPSSIVAAAVKTAGSF